MENFNPKLYEVIGRLSQHATQADIKEAYRKLAKHYHPDKNVGDEVNAQEKMQKLNEAYEILSDPEKRAAYDAKLKAHILKEEQDARLKKSQEEARQRHEKLRQEQAKYKAPKTTAFGGIPIPQSKEELLAVGGIALGALALGMLAGALFEDGSDNSLPPQT